VGSGRGFICWVSASSEFRAVSQRISVSGLIVFISFQFTQLNSTLNKRILSAHFVIALRLSRTRHNNTQKHTTRQGHEQDTNWEPGTQLYKLL